MFNIISGEYCNEMLVYTTDNERKWGWNMEQNGEYFMNLCLQWINKGLDGELFRKMNWFSLELKDAF